MPYIDELLFRLRPKSRKNAVIFNTCGKSHFLSYEVLGELLDVASLRRLVV